MLRIIEVTMPLCSAMRGRSDGATKTARTRYNVQSRGKDVGVESRQARSIRQRCSMGYLPGVVVIGTLQEKTKYR
jgi:hypothetical protein